MRSELFVKFAVPALISVCASLGAQSKTVSSPPGWETTEANSFGYYLGAYANERFQAADATSRKQIMLVKEISYRLDQKNYNPNSASGGAGKSWAKVTLHMSECDFDKMTSTFNTNPVTTPTKVYDSATSWATQSGYPSTKPAPWGGNGIRFPFKSTPWLYTGVNDMLLDYEFTGGTLANSGAWAGATSKRYYLDGIKSPNLTAGAATEYPASKGQTTPPNCMDSFHAPSTSRAAYNNIQGINVSNADRKSNPGEVYFQWRSFYTAPSKPVIKALGFAGVPAGIPIGTHCNKLYLDTTQPYFTIGQTAGSTGTSPFTRMNAKFLPPMGGISVWFQCAWDDSVLKRFSLTTASERKIPAGPPPLGPRRQSVRTSDPTAKTGSGPTLNGDNAGYAYNPIYLITYN
jgi:hypothetical protein